MFIDIHTHQYSRLSDLKEAIEVKCYYDLALNFNPDQLNKYQYFCLGIHPWKTASLELSAVQSYLKSISPLKLNAQFFGLGECGLDRLKGAPLDRQVAILKIQLQWAKQNRISRIVLHCVRAYDEILKIIKEINYDAHYIFHDFNASYDQAMILSNTLQCSFSLGQNFMRSNSKIHRYSKELDLSILFAETDERNYTIEKLYQEISNIKKIKINELEKQFSDNFDLLMTS